MILRRLLLSISLLAAPTLGFAQEEGLTDSYREAALLASRWTAGERPIGFGFGLRSGADDGADADYEKGLETLAQKS